MTNIQRVVRKISLMKILLSFNVLRDYDINDKEESDDQEFGKRHHKESYKEAKSHDAELHKMLRKLKSLLSKLDSIKHTLGKKHVR